MAATMRDIRTVPRSAAGGDAVEPIVSVERAFRIVEILAEDAEGMTLADLSRALDVNKGICHKLLYSLEGSGYVFRNPETGRFFLSYKLSNLSLRQLSRARLLEQCASVLQSLADETRELARLAIVQNSQLTWVLSLPGEINRHALQIAPRPHYDINLHTHATGKAWLATMSEARVVELMKARTLAARTPHSHVRFETLLADLRTIAECGYALSLEENELGIVAIAAPVLQRALSGPPLCVGTVSLAAPAIRASRADLERYAPHVMATAARLGAMWPLNPEAGIGTPAESRIAAADHADNEPPRSAG